MAPRLLAFCFSAQWRIAMTKPPSKPDETSETLASQCPQTQEQHQRPPTHQPGSNEVAETLQVPIPGAATYTGGSPAPAAPTPPDVTTEYRQPAPTTAPDLAAQSRGQTTAKAGGQATMPRQAQVSQVTTPGYAETLEQRTEPPAAPSAPAAPLPAAARRADRFVLKKFHAKGGMGEVWLAADSDIGREVALKRMRLGHEHQRDRFLLEAQITGQLEHPGVVPVHELGVNEEGQPFYVMKFVHGRTLEKAIKEYHSDKPASDVPREVQQLRLLEVFVDLCQTVAYAHSRGVLHRDLKPDNVMLGEYGETLVLDWGLAKVLGQPETAGGASSLPVRYSGESQETQAGTVQGTPSYMAPEVADGRTTEVDQRSDVYLLGGTLYQILTGKRPRKGDKLSEVIEMARTRPPVPPRKIKPDVPRALEAICQKALAHRREDRYPSAQALADDLHRYLAGEPVSAYREPFWEQAWRWARKHRRALGSAVAAALIVTAALMGYGKLREADRLRVAAEQEAGQFRERDQARRDVLAFRRQADEARFYLASLDPVGESAPCFDVDKGEASARAALAITEPWGPDLKRLVLTDAQPALRQELYDLLLLLCQALGRQGNRAADEMNAFLELAALLREPSRGYYRLRAQASRLAGNASKAEEAQRQANDPKTPTTAFDHYLLGDQYRAESVSPKRAGKKKADWQPDRDLVMKAMEQYRLALKLAPEHYWSQFQLGRCYLGLTQWAESAEALGACVATRPKSPWGYIARAFALTRVKRFAEAESDLNTALQLNPDLLPVRLNRGVLYMQQGKDAAALADFQAVLEAPPEKRLQEAAFYRAQLYLKKEGGQDKALEDLSKLVEAKPDFRPAYQTLAFVHFALGEVARGMDDLNQFLARDPSFDPKSADGYEQRGRCIRLFVPDLPKGAPVAKLLATAVKELQKAVELGGSSAALFGDLGASQEMLGRVKEAIQAYDQGLKLAPKDVKLLVKRGWAFEKLQQYDKAHDSFARAIEAQPDHAEAHTGLGYIEACQQQSADARREANRAVLLEGGDYLILHNVACIYAELAQAGNGQAKEYEDLAIDHLRRAVELWKRDRSTLSELVLIEKEGAFRPSLRSRPEFKELLKPEGP
jgi:tetratricopeptide (TPR) repeat protein